MALGSGRTRSAVYEANDAQLIAQWAQQWSDVISFEIYAAIDDAGFAKVIG